MIEAIILYSTNDNRFIYKCLDNLIKCKIKCHVIMYTHMWNGTTEDEALRREIRDRYATEDQVELHLLEWFPGQTAWYWEGLGRHLGTRHVDQQTEYLLYIDADEIVEPEGFLKWIKTKEFLKYDAIKIANYWYWREPVYRSTTLEDSVVLVRREIACDLDFVPGGRDNYFSAGGHSTLRFAGKEYPFIHHYSWVRTRKEMLKKVQNWGHNSDRTDWELKVNKEFENPFNGKDFLHNYEYETVQNIFNL